MKKQLLKKNERSLARSLCNLDPFRQRLPNQYKSLNFTQIFKEEPHVWSDLYTVLYTYIIYSLDNNEKIMSYRLIVFYDPNFFDS